MKNSGLVNLSTSMVDLLTVQFVVTPGIFSLPFPLDCAMP